MSQSKDTILEWENKPVEGFSIGICKSTKDVFDSDNLVKCYFLGGESDFYKDNPIGEGYRSCSWIEEQVYNIMVKKTWEAEDVFNILAWKVGKIKHLESYKKRKKDEKGMIIYADKWEKDKSIKMPYQKKEVSWEDFIIFAEKISEIRTKYINDGKVTDAKAKTAWKYLLDLANGRESYKGLETEKYMKGIGTVYLLTLLHFITKGEYPIYDRFAMASLIVRKSKEDVPRGSIINVGSLPNKDSDEAKKLLEDDSVYMQYRKLLNEFYNDEWKLSIEGGKIINYDKARNIDRALWVYGHFFDVRQ